MRESFPGFVLGLVRPTHADIALAALRSASMPSLARLDRTAVIVAGAIVASLVGSLLAVVPVVRGATALPTTPAPAAVAQSRQVVVTWSTASVGRTRAQRLAALRDPARVDRLSAAAGLDASFHRVFGTGATTGIYRFDAPLGPDAAARLARIAALPGVTTVEADPIATIDAPPVTLPDDPFASQQWNLLGPDQGSAYGIEVLDAWPTTTGSGEVVAMLDTGITAHTELAGQTVAGYDLITDAWTANDGDGADADPSDPGDFVTADASVGHCSTRNSSWHGTHVSGIVAAASDNATGVFSVAPAVRIQPVRVLGRCGGSFTDIADGITWASGGTVAGVPANATPADVLNLSLGAETTCPAFMQAAIDGARARGTLTVVSAGNGGVDASTQAPANCANVVTVAATNSSGTRSIFTSGSSNYGAAVEIAAPGSSILSTWNAGTTTPGAETYGSGSGTSQAAPHVAALAALLHASRPGAQPAALLRAIQAGAKPFAADASDTGCPALGCGAGIADAPAAVAFLATADIAAPVATVTRPAAQTKAASLSFAITFDEPVTGLAASDLSVSGTATGCVVGTPAGSDAAWTVAVTGCSDGTVTLALAAQAVADAVANVGPDAPAASGGVLVDRTAPSSSASVSATATNAASVDVEYTATDGTGSGVASVEAFASAAADLSNAVSCGSAASGAGAGTITCTLPAPDATYRVWTRATDALGTVEAAPGVPDDAVVRDATPPAATLVPAATATRTGGTTYTLAFTEPVTGLGAGDLQLVAAPAGCAIGTLTPTASGAMFPVTGCADGPLVVRLGAAAASDAAGNAGPVAPVDAATVTVDSVAPVVGAPTVALRGAPLSGTSIPVTVSWPAATDAGSGVASYALQRSTDGGSTWSTIATGLTTTSRKTFIASSGSTRFRVRATDRAGNVATGASSASRTGRLVQQTSSPVVFSTGWSTSLSTKLSGGSSRYTGTGGKSARFTFTGRAVALVTTRSTTRGKARISVDGVVVATVDLWRSSIEYRSVAWTYAWPSAGTHTIRVTVLGTAGRPRVDVDAFAYLK